MADDFECLELEQGGTLQLENEECIHIEGEGVECPPLPDDVCFVNYCPVPVCVWPEINEGVKAVSITESHCPGISTQNPRFRYPGIRLFNGDTSNIFNGTSDYPIVLPLQESDKIHFPLIQDERGQLRHYRPVSARGDYKIISKGDSIRIANDIFSSLAPLEGIEILAPGVKPPSYIGANATDLICSEGSTAIQLLRISELPIPILPV